MSIDVGLMLAQALPQIVGGANVEMTGDSNGFKNVDVVHRWFGWSAFGPLMRPFGARAFRPWRLFPLIGVSEKAGPAAL
jgi:hypothetical protein